jgi:serine/threonine-protein kinase
MKTQRKERLESQFSRVSSVILMVAILIVACGVSAITAMRFAIRGKVVSVPELIGKTEDEARKILEDNNLLFRVSSKRFDPGMPVGKIIAQSPLPGSSMKAYRSVKVWLSKGERKYAVPNLVGSSLRAAQLTLVQRDLTLGNTTMTHTVKGEASTIELQSPQPGSQEGTDPAVNVLVSSGPLAQDFVMPDLIGRPAELMASRARAEGFKIGKMNYRKLAGVESGVVIQQKPEAGNRLTKNETIFLEVSQ